MRAFIAFCLFLIAAPAGAQQTLPPELVSKIDAAVTAALAKSGAPSASVAIVKDGALAYAHAYGLANIEHKTPATPAMRYSIGSISKQFAATAVLMLVEDGKLSLDDKVSKFMPDLTRASDVTVRQLLTMTSGYQDYWPQDYVMPGMLEPITPEQIVERWARIPLDFEPGTAWQYSNTNFVIVGLIVQKVAGVPLFDFLQQRVFSRLGMASIQNIDEAGLGPADAARYTRFATAPPRPAPKEGRGWIFAAGELAMTACDLARWDISLIEQSVLKPSSYRALETEELLANGAGTNYGLGVSVSREGSGRRRISHSGEVSGFTALNLVYPDDRLAIVVLTNLDATDASGRAGRAIAELLLAPEQASGPIAQARAILTGLQHGQIDRTQLSGNASFYFSDVALRDFASSLGPLGQLKTISQDATQLRGGMTFRSFKAVFPSATVGISTYTLPDGKLEQFIVTPD